MLTDPSERMGALPRPGLAESGGCFQHVFRAEPDAVRNALRRAVARFARRISADDAGTLELTLAEVLNNVVEHGYCDLPPGLIHLRLVEETGALACRIEDFGRPMPGCAPPDCEFPPVAEDNAGLAEGGWGWALIRELSTDLGYERQNNRNILTFRVPVSNDTATE